MGTFKHKMTLVSVVIAMETRLQKSSWPWKESYIISHLKIHKLWPLELCGKSVIIVLVTVQLMLFSLLTTKLKKSALLYENFYTKDCTVVWIFYVWKDGLWGWNCFLVLVVRPGWETLVSTKTMRILWTGMSHWPIHSWEWISNVNQSLFNIALINDILSQQLTLHRKGYPRNRLSSYWKSFRMKFANVTREK